MSEFQEWMPAPRIGQWTLNLGIVFGGVILIGVLLLTVAVIRAAAYDGSGESGVYELVAWGTVVLPTGLASLLVLLAIHRRAR